MGRYRPGPGAHGRPALALGDPDGRAVSLGRRGRLEIRFARPVQNTGGPAPDLRLVDLPDGQRGRLDAAAVRATADGRTWQRVGRVSGSGRLDLGGLPEARAVRVVDRSPRSSGDGYDLDAVEVLAGCARR